LAGGRPTKYRPEYCAIVKKLCELGATVPEIAEALKVAESSVYLWAVQHAEFSESLKLGRDAPDERVVRSLFARATGYAHDDVDIRVVNGKIVKTKIKKRYPPDTKAALAWLYNRRPDEFRPQPKPGDDAEADAAQKVVIEVVDARKG